MNFDQIKLSKYELKILKKLLTTDTPIKEIPEEHYKGIRTLELVKRQADYNVSITHKGKMYLRYLQSDRIRFWFPIIISITALAISLIALFR